MVRSMIVGAMLACSGFLLGSQIRPEPINSELADAQLVSQDRDVRWVGYQCGEDGATYLTREMPNMMECKQVRRLSEEHEFAAPPRTA